MSQHPQDAELVAWLETERPARVGRHLEECARCLDRLDQLSDLGPQTRTGLVAATAPPVDLEDQTQDRLRDRASSEEAVSVVAGLFVVPWRVLEILVADGREVGDEREQPDG